MQSIIRDRHFTIRKPLGADTGPFVFNSPHSGREYPEAFIADSRLDRHRLRRSEDFLVDELFESVSDLGAPLLAARFPRAWLDVNREPYELDPAMFDGVLPVPINANSARVRGGLGTIARIVAESEEIYSRPLGVEDALYRIEAVYKPYHAALAKLLRKAFERHGYAVLVDCHSMPSTSGQNRNFLHPLGQRNDFVIGDRFSTSCSPMLTAAAVSILRGLGYRTAVNKPYAGGFITEHYGRPAAGIHALQIEINRALYMDEEAIARTSGFNRLAADLQVFSRRLMEIDWSSLEGSLPQAAE